MKRNEMHNIQLSITGISLDFELAKTFAQTAVSRITHDNMIVAWYDGQKAEEHPVVPECQHKPGWLAYAEGHGGSIKVDLNQGEFTFIFVAIS